MALLGPLLLALAGLAMAAAGALLLFLGRRSSAGVIAWEVQAAGFALAVVGLALLLWGAFGLARALWPVLAVAALAGAALLLWRAWRRRTEVL